MIRVNGRRHWFGNLQNLKRINRSTYTVERYGVEYSIEGGKHAGGTRREWFLDGPTFPGGSINCTSLVDALRTLDNL